MLSIALLKHKYEAIMLEELCYADDTHDADEQQNAEAVDDMDAIYEGPAEAMPAQDQDMAEEEQQHAEPVQQDKVLPSVNPAGVRVDLVGAQGTPKALASTLVCQHDLLVLAIYSLAQPCLESFEFSCLWQGQQLGCDEVATRCSSPLEQQFRTVHLSCIAASDIAPALYSTQPDSIIILATC